MSVGGDDGLVPAGGTLKIAPPVPGTLIAVPSITSRLMWASHASRNILFFVLLTVFVFSPDLLSQYPLPIEWALLITFIVPSLFPPYNVTFPGYLTIAILFLISFIFRGIAFQNWPYVTPEAVDLLLNSRTILSFLPLIQVFNVVLLTFHLPRLAILRRLLDPAVPIALILFIGFFLSLQILSDTHNSVRHTFDILLRTVLLDVRPGSLTEFHPIAARIVYYLFAFFSLYLFWGIGIAGVGMRVVQETDWDAERVRWKMLRLLKFLPDKKRVVKRGIFGRGKVQAAMPFNVIEGFGWAIRCHYFIIIPFYLGIAPTVLAWTVGRGVLRIGRVVRCLMGKIGGFLFDEWDTKKVGQSVQGDGGVAETSRLLS
jgi:hypothetical protein